MPLAGAGHRAGGGIGGWPMRRAPARYRHALWLGVLAAAAAVPFAGLLRPTPAAAQAGRGLTVPPWLAAGVAALLVLAASLRAARCLRAWFATRRVVRMARAVEWEPGAAQTIARCRRAFALNDIAVLASGHVPGPLACGTRHPVIVTPPALVNREPEDVVADVIGHEMAHVRRRDYAVNLACEILMIPLAWHPAARFLKRRVEETREMACDEMVAARLVEGPTYARSLVRVAELVTARMAPGHALGVTDGGSLEARLRRLLSGARLLGGRASRLRLAACAAVLIVIAGAAGWNSLRTVMATEPVPPRVAAPPLPPPPPPPPPPQ
jgi:beta-lactamase regulating signal transducer with metallopeptidase domain